MKSNAKQKKYKIPISAHTIPVNIMKLEKKGRNLLWQQTLNRAKQ